MKAADLFGISVLQDVISKPLYAHPVTLVIDDRWVERPTRSSLIPLTKVGIHIQMKLSKPPESDYQRPVSCASI
jgi:hypothetical protein